MNRFPYYLQASPSFFEGAGRVLDLGGTLQVYNYSTSPQVADMIASAEDWASVASDFQEALRIYVAMTPKVKREPEFAR